MLHIFDGKELQKHRLQFGAPLLPQQERRACRAHRLVLFDCSFRCAEGTHCCTRCRESPLQKSAAASTKGCCNEICLLAETMGSTLFEICCSYVLSTYHHAEHVRSIHPKHFRMAGICVDKHCIYPRPCEPKEICNRSEHWRMTTSNKNYHGQDHVNELHRRAQLYFGSGGLRDVCSLGGHTTVKPNKLCIVFAIPAHHHICFGLRYTCRLGN